MPIKDFFDHLNTKQRQRLGEIVRFGLVGITATLIQYGTYLLLLRLFSHNPAMTIAYFVSFLFNFIASTHYTFKVKANAKHGLGFAFSHVVNYFLQLLTLNLFIGLGVAKQWAPIPMFCLCVPINFVLVRFFLKH